MEIFISILFIVLPYLLGSIPSAVWISKYVYGSDVRAQGSGNAGSTNMFRIHGKGAGIATQLIDIAKGSLAAFLPLIFIQMNFEVNHLFSEINLQSQMLICGILAVVGHIYPVFAGFKGGKGINTLLGMMLVVNPLICLFCIITFAIVLLSTNYVSLGSILATLTFPLAVIILDVLNQKDFQPVLVALGFGMFALVMFTHRENIKRLIAGNENKANLFKQK